MKKKTVGGGIARRALKRTACQTTKALGLAAKSLAGLADNGAKCQEEC